MLDLAALAEPVKQAVHCDECRDDPTCTADDIARDWKFPAKRDRHQGSYHTPEKRCKRFLESCGALRQNPESNRVNWHCPWCGDEHGKDPTSTVGTHIYFAKLYLIRHIIEVHTSAEVDPIEFAIMQTICGVSSNAQQSADESMEDIVPSSDNLFCDECRMDPSLSEQKRGIKFKNVAGKKVHLGAKLHSPEARAIRMIKLDAARTHLPADAIPCPYCKDFERGTLADVCEHIVDDHGHLDPAVYNIYVQASRLSSVIAPAFIPQGERDAILLRLFEDAYRDAWSEDEDEDISRGWDEAGDEGTPWASEVGGDRTEWGLTDARDAMTDDSAEWDIDSDMWDVATQF
ncbi:hypothetical protein B0H13DRAFT_1993256 [Mycena leptocephala]|nr:hypothetical protein B0H13DRAFT_1993256 [Mycena leptocephala]